jgi:hypothetical protein
MMMSLNSGVSSVFVVVKSARYWTYRECLLIAPCAVISAVCQVASGVGVSPVLKKILRLVPAGVAAVQKALRQSTGASASNTRDTNDPAAW